MLGSRSSQGAPDVWFAEVTYMFVITAYGTTAALCAPKTFSTQDQTESESRSFAVIGYLSCPSTRLGAFIARSQ